MSSEVRAAETAVYTSDALWKPLDREYYDFLLKDVEKKLQIQLAAHVISFSLCQ